MSDLEPAELSPENWLEPDPLSEILIFPDTDDTSPERLEGYVETVLDVSLSPEVPAEVDRLFRTARAAIIYGYLYYPLFALGLGQLFRVMDAAAGTKCRQRGDDQIDNFHSRIEHLAAQGVIEASDRERWMVAKALRNWASHPEDQERLPPGVVIGMLEQGAQAINELFYAGD